MATAAQAKELDELSKVMMYQGCSVSQLGRIFRMDNRDIAKKIAGVPPCGYRVGYPIWQILDVAPHLVTPSGDFEAYLRNMNHKDLPPMLSKEFWSGLMSRRRYEKEVGELWETLEVQRFAADAFKQIRMSLLLMTDSVEREKGLTEPQRAILQRLINTTMEDIRARLVTAFDKPDPQSGTDESEDGGL